MIDFGWSEGADGMDFMDGMDGGGCDDEHAHVHEYEHGRE